MSVIRDSGSEPWPGLCWVSPHSLACRTVPSPFAAFVGGGHLSLAQTGDSVASTAGPAAEQGPSSPLPGPPSASASATWPPAHTQRTRPSCLGLSPYPRTSGLPRRRLASSFPPQPLPPPNPGEPQRNPAGKSAAAGAPPAGGDGSWLALPVPLSCQKEGLMGPQVPSPDLELFQGRAHTSPWPRPFFWTSMPGARGSL